MIKPNRDSLFWFDFVKSFEKGCMFITFIKTF